MASLLSSAGLFWARSLIVFLLLAVPSTRVEAQQCAEGDEVCMSNAQVNQQFTCKFINKSRFRADIHWDDGGYGTNIAFVEPNGGSANINTQVGHKFFVTRHGVKEGLHDPKTDNQHRFTVSKSNEVFTIPSDAAPSKERCQDRFSICESEAAKGKCSWSPGWMIVHCCKSCDKELDASRLIDPKVRCTRENLNVTTPAWGPGDLNKLFTSWATESQFKQYEPQVLSSPGGEHGGIDGPWIITFDNFLSDWEADGLIKGGHKMGFDRSTDQGETNEIGEQ
eukprot:9429551-Ditylum_brightwellii.AAC.1